MTGTIIPLNQGQESNNSGGMLESLIEREFRQRGVPVFTWAENANNGDLFAGRMVLRNVPYASLYGFQSRSELMFRDFAHHLDVRIECRWQQVPGSTDEKLHSLFYNALDAMPEHAIWLIVDGGGARAGIVNWARRSAAQQSKKTIRVLTLSECRQRIKNLVERGEA